MFTYSQSEHENYFHKPIFYFMHLGVSWVAQWFYDIKGNSVSPHSDPINSLIRKYRIKWWDEFKSWEKLEEHAVINLINLDKAKKLSTNPVNLQASFLHDRGQLISLLANSQDPAQLKNILEQALELIKARSSRSSSRSNSGSHQSGDTNEDDCCGINLADP